MKTKRMIAVAIFAMMAFTASVAFAASTVSLEVVDNGDGTANVVATGTGSVAGAAFTVKSDAALTVTSEFFETFVAQGIDGTVDGFDKALVANEIDGGLMIAAANATAKDVADGEVLFTLTGTSDTDDTYAVSIEATSLNNKDAGYDEAGEEINLLIGIEGDTYPALLEAADVGNNVTAGSVTVSSAIPGDANDDKNVNVDDIIAVINHIFDANVTLSESGQKAADMDNNDAINVDDIIAIINTIFGG